MITVQTREAFLHQLIPYIPSDSVGAEIGVLHGDFSRDILNIIKPTELFLIDPYKTNDTLYGEKLVFSPTAYSTENDYQDLIRKFEYEIVNGRITVLRNYSYEAVKFVKDKSFDFIYIDSDHTYEAVKRDLEDWMVKIKPKGVISGHDHIDFDNFGVKDAVLEFCGQYKFEMVILNEEGGDYALKRRQ